MSSTTRTHAEKAGVAQQRSRRVSSLERSAGENTAGRSDNRTNTIPIGIANDGLEREAERIAARADMPAGSFASANAQAPVRVQRADASGACGGPAPPEVGSVLASTGRALDAATRMGFETRFGHDFSRVRIHDDAQAAGSAQHIGARAYAFGHHIVFAARRYEPQTASGRELIAHELVHVLQQTRDGAARRVQRDVDPNAEPAVWYQEAVDSISLSDRRMAEQRARGEFVFAPIAYDTEKAVLALCRAVDRKDAEATKKELDVLLKGSLWVHLQVLSRDLLTELSARMFEMGLEAEADRLHKRYAEEDRSGPYNDDMYAARRKLDFLGRLVKGAPSKVDKPEALADSMHRFARSFWMLHQAYLAIDWERVQHDRESRMGHSAIRPLMTSLEYYESIRELIWTWHKSWDSVVQQAMDRARTDLESASPTGSGALMLKALRTALVGELEGVLFPGQGGIAEAESQSITATTMKGKGKGEIADAYAPDDRSRRVPVTTYDPNQEWARELQGTIASSWRARLDQIQQLGRIYGVLDALEPKKQFADTMAQAEAAVDTGQSVREAKGLKLDSDDSWRAFLLQKFHDLIDASAAAADRRVRPAMAPGEALKEIVSLLFGYLRAFTVHARYTNIYDVGTTPYFNRPFPRAQTGQLVHDCGVYAMRAAYMLSLVRKELGLKFYFVRLPAHVSLVINGDSGSKYPTFVVENNHYRILEPDVLDKRRKSWESFQDIDTDKPPPGPADSTQFIGELASADFIGGPLDMPMRVSEVPHPIPDAKAEQRQLWAYYQGKALDDVFGPSSANKDDPNYLFHTRYLALTEKLREIHNDSFLPFWNVAGPKLWGDFEASVRSAAKGGAKDEIDKTTLVGLVQRYHMALYDALDPIRKRMDGFHEEERRLGRRLREDPKLAKAGVRFSAGVRAATLFRYPWEWHEDDVTGLEADLLGETGNAPVADVLKLRPGWMPSPENALGRLD